MKVTYTYVGGTTFSGVKCLCVSELHIGGEVVSFFDTAETKEKAQSRVCDLILDSTAMRNYVLSGGERANAERADIEGSCILDMELDEYMRRFPLPVSTSTRPTNTCATGCSSSCVGCYECNDGERKRLLPFKVQELDAELEKYMRLRSKSKSLEAPPRSVRASPSSPAPAVREKIAPAPRRRGPAPVVKT